ncbi:MAG TPA: hypothetical protein ENN29_04715 [Candidatus Hydrogenedentes bacterium]|nr:hypothetical protein [Candidatus Hydrogenedentota bacterium]
MSATTRFIKGLGRRWFPQRTDLRDIFCHEYTRVLANDWTITYNGMTLQVLKLNKLLHALLS